MRRTLIAVLFSISAGASASFASNVVDASGGVDTNITAYNSTYYGDALGLYLSARPYEAYLGTGARIESQNYGVDVTVSNSQEYPVPTAGYKANVTGYAYAKGVDLEVQSTGGYEAAWGVYALINDGVYSFGTDASVTGQLAWGARSNVYAYNGEAYGYDAYVSAGYGYSTYGVNVQAYANGGAPAYGVYAYASGGSGTYAGFFDGPVYSSGGYYPSDERLKKNVAPLNGGLDIIMALKPKTYEMKTEEFKDHLTLPTGKQYGLIAQEVEKTLPELIHPVVAPAKLTKEEQEKHVKKASFEFKSVDYSALIPILVDAVQEQQATIKALETKVAQLEAR